MLQAPYKNYKVHHALTVNCRVSLKVVLTARRIVFAINLADESRALACAAATGKAWSRCWAARWRHDQRRCWSRPETATNFYISRPLKCRNNTCRNNACRNSACRNSACRNRNCLPQPTVSKHWRRVVSHPDRPQSNHAHLTVFV